MRHRASTVGRRRRSRGGAAPLLLSLAVIGLAAAPAAADETSSASGRGTTSLLVLEFELDDLTLYPKVEQERARVASLRPLLTEALAERSSLALPEPPAEAAEESARGRGYLFERPAVAARLGRRGGADWVLTGRLHKASHLFVYLQAQLVDVARERVAADFVVELKGWGERLTRRGTDTLATQLLDALATLGGRAGDDAAEASGRVAERRGIDSERDVDAPESGGTLRPSGRR